MNNSQNNNSFQTMLIVMLAIYSIFFNAVRQSGGSFGLDFFTYVKKPAQVTHYTLRFDDVNGERINDPIYLDSPNNWIEEAERADALDLVNKLGIAVYDGDIQLAQQLHDELIGRYFEDIDSATYDLVLRVVNPVEKYSLDDEPIVDQHIQRYEFQRVLSAN